MKPPTIKRLLISPWLIILLGLMSYCAIGDKDKPITPYIKSLKAFLEGRKDYYFLEVKEC